MDENEIIKKAEKRVKAKKAFYISFLTWALFAIFFLFLDIRYGNPRLDWAFYPIFFWGIGVFFQAIGTFDFFGLGEKWEKNEIRKEIEKRRQIYEELEDPTDLDRLDLEELKELKKNYRDSDLV